MNRDMETIRLAIEVKRETRSPKVIDLCDRVINGIPEVAIVNPDKVIIGDPIDRPKFDKSAYMRDYMRKRREAERNG